MKVLVSAYACEPGRGSEPGVGWNVAREMAKHHEVWVLTREINRAAIEAERSKNPVPGLHFVYYDLTPARSWSDGHLEWQLYYYLWQIGVYFKARQLHRKVGFDLLHHATFVKYWGPSFLSLLPVPFLWGPVGGGDSTPKAFRKDYSFRAQIYEALRDIACWVGEHDPFVRLTARRSVSALATTEETAVRLRKLAANDVQVLSAVALLREDIERLGYYEQGQGSPIRFISIGRLLHWKGFHLGLRAFSRAHLLDSEYWIVGDGPERGRLELLAKKLGVEDRVRFWGSLHRQETLAKLEECDVLVHPSLHDSGGWVCLEAMAAGRPVICLDLGGPAMQVTQETGIKIPARSPEQVVTAIAEAMNRMASDWSFCHQLGKLGRERVASTFASGVQAEYVSRTYLRIVESLSHASDASK